MSTASVKGISLEKGAVVVLSFDGTLVYIEDIQPMWAAVIALPEQPDTRKADSIVFTPGAVRAKKISPYAASDKVVALGDLSDKNREFITLYPTLRDDRGANYIFGKVETVPVKKVKPTDVDDPTGAALPRGRKSRAEKRAAARASNCATCGKQKADPIHDAQFSDKYDHDFVAPSATPAKEATMPTGRGKPARPSSPSNGAKRYTLVSEDLTAALAQPKGERYAEGNRFHRVVQVLAALPDKSGTVEDIIAALLTDGGKIPSNPEKVVRRCLSQITTAAFGALVKTT